MATQPSHTTAPKHEHNEPVKHDESKAREARAQTSAPNSVPPASPEPPINSVLSVDEQKALVGESKPGIGWIKLGEDGEPTGTVLTELPKGDQSAYARVVIPPENKRDVLVTPSGAPITKQMNPEPVLWDEGMLSRNPIPGSPVEPNFPPQPASAVVTSHSTSATSPSKK